MTVLALTVLLAYLLGSISFSYGIVRVLKGIDIRTVGSGNAGATNVLRVAGRGPALLALLLDAGKGAAAVGVARLVEASPAVVAAAGAAAVLGHVYPLFFGLRGGKGVATAAGTLLTLVPWPTLAALVLFVLLVAWKRYVSLGSIAAAASFPPLVLGGGRLGLVPRSELEADLYGSFFIAALVIWKHRANIGRLLAGTESKFGQRVKTKDVAADTVSAESSSGSEA